MGSPLLVPCLKRLTLDLDAIAPDRDRSLDGDIGDPAHQKRVSDHNDDEVGRVPIRDADSKHEVHAKDLGRRLNTPGLYMEMVVQHIVGRCRTGDEDRLRYVIYNRRIWEASNGWRERAFVGDNLHIEHAHFSGSYVTALEADTRSWRLEDIPVALTDDDKKWLSTEMAKVAKQAAKEVWDTEWNIERTKGAKAYMAKASQIVSNIPSEHTRIEDAASSTSSPK